MSLVFEQDSTAILTQRGPPLPSHLPILPLVIPRELSYVYEHPHVHYRLSYRQPKVSTPTARILHITLALKAEVITQPATPVSAAVCRRTVQRASS